MSVNPNPLNTNNIINTIIELAVLIIMSIFAFIGANRVVSGSGEPAMRNPNVIVASFNVGSPKVMGFSRPLTDQNGPTFRKLENMDDQVVRCQLLTSEIVKLTRRTPIIALQEAEPNFIVEYLEPSPALRGWKISPSAGGTVFIYRDNPNYQPLQLDAAKLAKESGFPPAGVKVSALLDTSRHVAIYNVHMWYGADHREKRRSLISSLMQTAPRNYKILIVGDYNSAAKEYSDVGLNIIGGQISSYSRFVYTPAPGESGAMSEGYGTWKRKTDAEAYEAVDHAIYSGLNFVSETQYPDEARFLKLETPYDSNSNPTYNLWPSDHAIKIWKFTL